MWPELYVREVLLQLVEEPRLVLCRHSLGDAHDELHATLGSLQNRAADTGGGDEDAAGIGTGLSHRVADRGEHRDAVDVGARLLRVGARHHVGAVVTVQ